MTDRKEDAIRLAAAQWAEREWSRRMTTADQKALQDWLSADPAHPAEFELALRLLNSDELTRALASAGRDYAIRPTRAPARRPVLQPFWIGVGMATVAAAAVLTVTALMPTTIAPAGPAKQMAATAHLATANGQRRTELLSDGSRIDLNGGTRLTTAFTSTGRRIELAAGDAAFQVAADASRPFVVSTQHLSATALGTAFSVSRFEGHSTVRVTEHEVRIASKLLPDRAIVARSGDSVDVDAVGEITVTHETDAAGDWRDGWIDTQAITLLDLAEAMERRTGRAIKVAPSVRDLTVSGRFRIDEPEAVLRRVELLHDLAVTKMGDGFALTAAPPG